MTLDKIHVLAIAIAITLGLFSVYSHEESKLAVAQAEAKTQQQLNLQIQKQNNDFQTQVSAQIASLQQQNQTLQSQLVKQQNADKQLSPGDLAQRVASLVHVDPKDIQPTTAGFDLTSNAVLQTALQLEQVPILTTQLSNTKNALDLETKAHTSDKEASTSALKTVNDNLTSCKADLKKSKLKWFGIGYVAGFISGVVAKAY